ncbi:hypothetical protein HID58_012985 [Brassica napus]|uniref:Uncharacterized protein n=1 Tax=Brassica napus TaxID=3708 RepID=A0ABQ8E348_BRANA|nr:hypothetical protein HID58_012985 [Brassica napus]
MANNLEAISKDDFLSEEERLLILKTEVESLKEPKEHTYLFDGTVDLNVLAAKTMNATRGHLKTLVGTACAFVIRAEDKKRGHEVPSGEVLTVTMEDFDFAWGLVKQIDPAEFEKKRWSFEASEKEDVRLSQARI